MHIPTCKFPKFLSEKIYHKHVLELLLSTRQESSRDRTWNSSFKYADDIQFVYLQLEEIKRNSMYNTKSLDQFKWELKDVKFSSFY